MSYNYLPIDRKWLSFQQVKNLLDYNQLVSITFDAHEKIIECHDYINNIASSKMHRNDTMSFKTKLIENNAWLTGNEVPVEIVKLMLMLKIKSLSFGYSGVQIDIVKRLMEMYNNAVFPIVYMQSPITATSYDLPLIQLVLPLAGLGEVNFKGQKKPSLQVFNELNWPIIHLKNYEEKALISGTQTTSAYGLYLLKAAEQLLQFADVIAALSIHVFDCNIQLSYKKLHDISAHLGQVETASNILKYLREDKRTLQKNISIIPYSFSSIPDLHGAAKDTFKFVLKAFLEEINSVAGELNIFPGDEQVFHNAYSSSQTLWQALHFLTTSINKMATISQGRINELFTAPIDNFEISFLSILQNTVADVMNENKQLCNLNADTHAISENEQGYYLSATADAASKAIRLIQNVEKIFAIELIIATQILQQEKMSPASSFLGELLKAFNEQVPITNKAGDWHVEIENAIYFMISYKI